MRRHPAFSYLGAALLGAVAAVALLGAAALVLAISAALGFTLATAAPVLVPGCDWSAPGSARYTGTLAAAIDNYTDIPQAARRELQARIAAHRYDDRVEITRDEIRSVRGPARYAGLRNMHWRAGMCAGPVLRGKWSVHASEGALVYCSGPHCIIVPAICGNVAQVDRVATSAARADPAPPPAAEPPQTFAPTPEPAADSLPPDAFQRLAAVLPQEGPQPPPGAARWAPGYPTWPPAALPVVWALPFASPVPEPAAWVLLAAGLGLLWACRPKART